MEVGLIAVCTNDCVDQCVRFVALFFSNVTFARLSCSCFELLPVMDARFVYINMPGRSGPPVIAGANTQIALDFLGDPAAGNRLQCHRACTFMLGNVNAR